MNNYFTETVWKIDVVLLFIAVFLTILLIARMVFKNYLDNRRAQKLLSIKKNVYDLILSGKKIEKNIAFPLKDLEPNIFLDIATNRNRESAFFNKSEQEILKEYFADKKHIPKLEKIVNKSGNKWSRIEAILSIGYCEIDSLLPALKKSLWDNDEDIAYFTILALAQLKTLDSAKTLLDFLKTRSFYRSKIVSVFGQFPHEISGETMELVKSENPTVRFWGIKVLTEIKTHQYLHEIEQFTKDKSAEIRSAACECLGASGNKNVVPALEACLKDEMWLVRMSAVKAIERILGTDSISIIIPLIKDNSWFVIDSAKNVIAKHIESAIPPIEKILEGKDELAKKICIEAIETSGYVSRLYRDIFSGDTDKKKRALSILSNILKSSPGYGLQTALYDLNKDEMLAVLQAFKTINKEWVEAVEAKLGVKI